MFWSNMSRGWPIEDFHSQNLKLVDMPLRLYRLEKGPMFQRLEGPGPIIGLNSTAIILQFTGVVVLTRNGVMQ